MAFNEARLPLGEPNFVTDPPQALAVVRRGNGAERRCLLDNRA